MWWWGNPTYNRSEGSMKTTCSSWVSAGGLPTFFVCWLLSLYYKVPQEITNVRLTWAIPSLIAFLHFLLRHCIACILAYTRFTFMRLRRLCVSKNERTYQLNRLEALKSHHIYKILNKTTNTKVCNSNTHWTDSLTVTELISLLKLPHQLKYHLIDYVELPRNLSLSTVRWGNSVIV